MRTLRTLRTLFVLALLPAGCGGTPETNPAPGLAGQPDAGADTPQDAAADVTAPDAAPDANVDGGPILREVSFLDPFGKLDPANMFHDGDFEHSGSDAFTYPWFGIDPSYVRIGAACSSGLRCIEMPRSHYVLGMFVWPDAPYAEVSFHAKPAGLSCEGQVDAIVALLDGYALETPVVPETAEPVDGWCHHTATVYVSQERGYHTWGLFLSVLPSADGPVVFDDVSMVGQEESVPTQRSLEPVSAEVLRLRASAKERLRALLPPNPPRRPSPVRNPTGRRLMP